MRPTTLALATLLSTAFAPRPLVAQTAIDFSLPTAVFTSPTKVVKKESDTIIRDKLVALINAATENSSIYLMIYLLDDSNITNALVAAAGENRKVSVNVVLDWSEGGSGKTTNATAFAALDGKIAKLYRIANPMGIIHNKFALFTQVKTNEGVAESVIFETSSNLKSSSYLKFQDALIFADATLFQKGFVAYWNDVVAKGNAGTLENYDYRNQLGNQCKAYFYPKRKDCKNYGYDTAALILGHVISASEDCKGVGAQIRIAMSLWSQSRDSKESPSIFSQLKVLAGNSANTIEVLIPDKSTNKYMIDKLQAFAKDHSNFTVHKLSQNLHSKYMLIDGFYGHQGHQKLVFAGSENFTRPALRSNFETWVKYVRDANSRETTIYSAYLANFNAIIAAAGTGDEAGSE